MMMMLPAKYYSLLLFAFVSSFSIKAQDSIPLFKKTEQQYSSEINFRNNFYYNPANKLDYSSASFSEFKIGYHDDHQKVYRKQLGAGEKGLFIETESYLKVNKNRTIWGKASYENLKNKSTQWMENLDFDRVAPYITADSVSGNLNLERYFFEGGISEKIHRWTLGAEVSYLAQLGYRTHDPRLRSTTSDLVLHAGVNYRIFKEYELGVFGKFNKYTQNSSLTFASLLGKPYVYQMNGLGFSNYFFNGGSNPVESYEEFGVNGGLQISNKQGKDFYIRAITGISNSIKSHNDSGIATGLNLSDLENKNFELEGAKFFTTKGNNRIGMSANYKAQVKTGLEYGYSVNNIATEQIFKRKAYRYEDYSTMFKAFYQYNHENFTLSATPFLGFQEIKEKRIYPNSGQKFEYSFLGFEANYRQKIKENQVIAIHPYFSKRVVNKTINVLSGNINNEITNWVIQDYHFQASDLTTFGTTLRYDIKFQKLPAFFASMEWQSQKIQNKYNNFVGATLGITF